MRCLKGLDHSRFLTATVHHVPPFSWTLGGFTVYGWLEGELLSVSRKCIRLVLAKWSLLDSHNCWNYSSVFWFNLYILVLSGLDESILEECLQHLEKQLESSQARKAMEEFFSERWSIPEIYSPGTWLFFLFLSACHCQHLRDVNTIAQEPCRDRIPCTQCRRVWKDFLCERGPRSLSLQIKYSVIPHTEWSPVGKLFKGIRRRVWEVLVYRQSQIKMQIPKFSQCFHRQ